MTLFLVTIVFVVVGVGLLFGLPVYRQQRAIREIKRLGGSIGVRRNPLLPNWTRQLLGREAVSFDSVTSLQFSRITDGDLAVTTGLPDLEQLDVDATEITDAGMPHIGKLRNLRLLSLSQTRISDAGLAHLRNLPKLKTLYLGGNRITDQGLAQLEGLANLEQLNIDQTRISDASVTLLKRLPALTDVSAQETRITADGVAELHQGLPAAKIRWSRNDDPFWDESPRRHRLRLAGEIRD